MVCQLVDGRHYQASGCNGAVQSDQGCQLPHLHRDAGQLIVAQFPAGIDAGCVSIWAGGSARQVAATGAYSVSKSVNSPISAGTLENWLLPKPLQIVMQRV